MTDTPIVRVCSQGHKNCNVVAMSLIADWWGLMHGEG